MVYKASRQPIADISRKGTKMENIVWTLALLLIVALGASGVQSAANVTVYMDDYIRLNQQQYDAVLREYEGTLANCRSNYAKELRAIDVQADQLQVKLEEAAGRLRPLQLIDTWHKLCVQNYSSNIPLISTMRTAMSACSTAAQNNLNSYLDPCQRDYNSLKSYYTNTFKTAIKNCEKNNPTSQFNYSTCITTVVSRWQHVYFIRKLNPFNFQIANANKETINSRKNFNTHFQQATCSTELRVTQAWECAFTTVYSTSTTVGTALQLVDDCIANKLACASVSCTSSCANHMILGLSPSDFNNATIKNPFYGLNSNIGCMLMTFK